MREYVPGFDGQRLVRKDELPLDANWKFILDGLESYHTPIIHPQVMSGKNAYVTKDIVITTDEYYSTHITKGNYELLENHKDRLPYPMDDLAVKDILIWFLWPNLVFVSRQGPSNFQILQATPQAPDRSVRYAINLCLREEPNEFDFAHMDTYRDVIWPQDRQAMEQQQVGVVSRGYTQGRLLADAAQSWWSEHATHHFEHLVWTALNGNDYREELNRP
jgi:phenylpropionate dioxygenase-like ring-hydroxylating dioxygenase large terminal subunit